MLGPFLGLTFGIILARAYVIWHHKDCFDVYAWPGDGTEDWQENTNQQREFVAAYLLKKLPGVFRFRFWIGLMEDRTKGWAAFFPPFIGLTGLDDDEGTVRKMYLKFLPERRKHPDLDEMAHGEVDKYPKNPFASAVAVVLGAGEEEEKKLVELLDLWHGELAGGDKRDWRLKDEGEIVQETFRPALPFMADGGETWSPRTKWQAITDIESGLHSYYVGSGANRVDIHVVNGTTGKYLRTDLDKTSKNNLDDLPNC